MIDGGSVELLGRAVRGSPSDGARQLFGSIGDAFSITPPALLALDGRITRTTFPRCGLGPGFYVISGTAREVLRYALAPVGPLSLQQIVSGEPLPAGAVRAPRASRIKMQVRAELYGSFREFSIDACRSIEVYAEAIEVAWVVPANFVTIPSNAAELRELAVVDAFVSVGVARAEAPIGNGTSILTTIEVVPNTEIAIVEVPPFATGVQIMQSGLGTAAALWECHMGDPSVASMELGELPVDPAATRMIPMRPLPADCTHLRVDAADAANYRVFTFAWEIAP